MILEGAFYKLPEILFSSHKPRHQYEGTLAGHFAMALLLELNSRNVLSPQSHIHLEHPYEVQETGRIHRADLYVNLEGLLPGPVGLHPYGLVDHNWVEAKYFVSMARSVSQSRSRNAAQIARDLLRLCLNTPEPRTSTRENGRYLLLVFNLDPARYLGLSAKRGLPGWLRILLTPGHQKIRVEEPTLVSNFSIDVTTYAFEPINPEALYYYWGYLVRVRAFDVKHGGMQLDYSDHMRGFRTDEQRETLARLRRALLRRMDSG